MNKIVLILFLSFFSISNSFSQTIEFGVFGGGSYYLGDLNPGKHFLLTKPAYGIIVRYVINDRLALRINALHGKVAGDDEISKFLESRKLKFESGVTDIGAQFEFNFLNYFTGSKNNFITPYFFGGISILLFNPKADGHKLQPLGTEGQENSFEGRKPYSLSSFAIPFGVGVKYSLSNKIGIGFEWGIRKTFTDYLDDVSTTYYLSGSRIDPNNPAEYLSDPAMDHESLMQRGNSKNNDWCVFTGLTITYKINLSQQKGCSDFQKRNYN